MKTLLFNVAATLGVVLIGATAAQAHARLNHAIPAAGSTVSPAPNQVTLSFSENLEPRFSGGDVVSSSGAHVDKGSTVSGKTTALMSGAWRPEAMPSTGMPCRWTRTRRKAASVST